MKAVRFHEYGGSEVLRFEDVEQPVPGAGQVRVRVAATSFNAVDGGIRGGYCRARSRSRCRTRPASTSPAPSTRSARASTASRSVTR